MSLPSEPVDRHEEVVERQQAGYAEREAVVVDEVAGRRAGLSRVTQLIWLLAGLLEALLALRLFMRLIAVNPDAPFAQLVYGFTAPFLLPFQSLIGTPSVGDAALEITTIFAMIVYALIAWALAALFNVLFARSYATSRTVHRRIDTDIR
ncbi:MAG: YggT family protein [Anaerolineales bacterium]